MHHPNLYRHFLYSVLLFQLCFVTFLYRGFLPISVLHTFANVYDYRIIYDLYDYEFENVEIKQTWNLKLESW